jgi:hypothetical protein
MKKVNEEENVLEMIRSRKRTTKTPVTAEEIEVRLRSLIAAEKYGQIAEKYERLVWYARKTEEDIETIDAVREQCKQIEEDYEDECVALNSIERGDWQHGFNSGILAAARYFWAIETGVDEDYADECFPELDT